MRKARQTGLPDGRDTVSTSKHLSDGEFLAELSSRIQLSIEASRIALVRSGHPVVREFAGFEIEVLLAILKAIDEIGHPLARTGEIYEHIIEDLWAASEMEFERLYVQTEIANHEWLHKITESYLHSFDGDGPGQDTAIQNFATVALPSFNGHIARSRKVYDQLLSELTAPHVAL